MGFISFFNDKLWDDADCYDEIPFDDRYCREILNSNRIMHIYMVMPENTSICIEYLSKRGDWFEIHETFNSQAECLRRFLQLENILKEDKS